MKNKNRFLYDTRPLAHSENMVKGSNYRFTVLTPSLVRMEYSENGIFEDRASQFAFFRDFPVQQFTANTHDGLLTIETSSFVLTYKENTPFTSDTLSIRLKIEPASTWNFGDRFDDLGGTAETLDNTNGPLPLDRGVCSRYGFSVIDDSETVLLTEDGWIDVRQPNSVDVYFWGFGYHYLDAVKTLYQLTGAPPLLPAYALGNWWSRYHAYTQEEYQNLILRFEEEEVPFSVAVVDMDWHITKIPEECKDANQAFNSGWTGYTWNKELFPDYKAFLKFFEEHNLKTSLNLHPAQGVGCHEEMYEEMALACGIDPATKERVKLDLLSPDFMEKYFDILHHPYEEAGVNFWWMDWQQGRDFWWIHEANKDGNLQNKLEIVHPLWLLNHLHIADIKRNGLRPMFFSRYSGPGSHRYPVGFSGDTMITWEALDFQPYFTLTASNVGYSWWSHDIGGHMRAYQNDELMTRWVQYGVFSPINRLHSSNEIFSGKEPWHFGYEAEIVMKKWLNLRHYLFPYIYTMNYRNYKDLEPLVQPMYYAHPKRDAAYEVKNQFMFGSELMVAPITQPNNNLTHHGVTEVWFPEGDWFDFFTGLHYTSIQGRKLHVSRSLHDYPVFAKAGAIVPMQQSKDLTAGNDLEIIVFPGMSNSFTLYEDDGDGSDYEHGAYIQTEMNLDWAETPVFTLKPAVGDLSLLPEKRNYRLVFRGYHESVTAKVWIDGKLTETVCEYDKETRALCMNILASVSSEVRIELLGNTLITDNGDTLQRCIDLIQTMQLSYNLKDKLYEILSAENQKLSITYRSALNRKLAYIYRFASVDEEYKDVIYALQEQLLLIDMGW